MATITAPLATLSFWVGTAVLFVVLWIGRLFLDVVAKEVIKAQGGDALAQRINRDLTLFRTGLAGEERPRRPYAFYFGNAIGFLITCAMVFNKVVFFSVGDTYTAILHAFSLVLWPFLYPIVSRHWRAFPESWFFSGVTMSLCVTLAGAPFILIPAFLVEHIVRLPFVRARRRWRRRRCVSWRPPVLVFIGSCAFGCACPEGGGCANVAACRNVLRQMIASIVRLFW